jgi:hypothetical protein
LAVVVVIPPNTAFSQILQLLQIAAGVKAAALEPFVQDGVLVEQIVVRASIFGRSA